MCPEMKIVRHIPNTITSMNLLCGVLGVICTFEGRMDTAFCLMLAASVFDFCDGLVARLLNAYSDIGKELDSLSDMVSFGVLPALMMYRLMVSEVPEGGLLCFVPLVIAVFSGLRLAKFNVDERQSENFIGLATPACAILCGSFVYFVGKEPAGILHGWAASRFFIPAVSIVLSALLVSEIPMFSMKFKKGHKALKRVVFQRIAFLVIVVASCVLAAILKLNWSFAVLVSFSGYILLNVCTALVCHKK
ncbi:MAG: CDP-diacylglycerol--serine O-phosphatidyltransferase [Candidatus Cryptobacteroides sp.]